MNTFLRSSVTGLSLLIGVPAAAFAADGPAYPISVTQGENSVIEHGPGNPAGTLVGGGRVVATGSGEDARAQHLDAGFQQGAPAGMVAVSVGSGENSSVIFVPAASLGLRG